MEITNFFDFEVSSSKLLRNDNLKGNRKGLCCAGFSSEIQIVFLIKLVVLSCYVNVGNSGEEVISRCVSTHD